MSVQMQQFRVVGVRHGTGQDVSIVIDAATKAAAEVKAEQMDIETTHIVRLKQDEQTPPDEYELFSNEAAEALAGKRTDKLIEEVASPDETAPPQIEPPQPTPQAMPEPQPIAPAITRPTYAAAASGPEPTGQAISGMRAFGFVLVVLLSMTAGAYYVLIHEPNNVQADPNDLVFGEGLFSDVLDPDSLESADITRDAFNNRASNTATEGPPIATHQQVVMIGRPNNSPAQAASAAGPTQPPKFVLQSVVTSHEGRFAVINGKFYKEGADVAGAKLVSVADDWVLMQQGDEQFTLQIEAKNDGE